MSIWRIKETFRKKITCLAFTYKKQNLAKFIIIKSHKNITDSRYYIHSCKGGPLFPSDFNSPGIQHPSILIPQECSTAKSGWNREKSSLFESYELYTMISWLGCLLPIDLITQETVCRWTDQLNKYSMDLNIWSELYKADIPIMG